MKTEISFHNGVLKVSCVYEGLHAFLDVTTGEVLSLDYGEHNIVKLHQFITKVKSRYTKFAAEQQADEFTI